MAAAMSPLTAGRFNVGNKKIRMADVTLTGSYPTGGETITPASLGMKRVLNVLGNVTEAAGQTTNWAVHWDPANNKLKLFGAAVGATGMTEHAAAAYATATVGHLVFIGE